MKIGTAAVLILAMLLAVGVGIPMSLGTFTEKVKWLNSQVTALDADNSALQGRVDNAESANKTLIEDNQGLNLKVLEIGSELDAQKLINGTLQKENDDFKQKLESAAAQQTEQQNQLNAANTALQHQIDRNTTLEQQYTNAVSEVNTCKTQLADQQATPPAATTLGLMGTLSGTAPETWMALLSAAGAMLAGLFGALAHQRKQARAAASHSRLAQHGEVWVKMTREQAARYARSQHDH